jgi:exodeoxyribonuclease-3
VTLRILSYNIRRGGRGREAAIASVIHSISPDIVVLEEAVDPQVVEELARLTEMEEWSSRRGESLAFMSRSRVARYAWHKPRISRHAFLEILPATSTWRVFGFI